MDNPLIEMDADRLVRMLEASRAPWPRLMSTILFYAAQADCAYRRMDVGAAAVAA